MDDKRQMAKSALGWTRSSYCADQACVEVAPLNDGSIGIRDAKTPEQPHLAVGRNDWHVFLDRVAEGHFNTL